MPETIRLQMCPMAEMCQGMMEKRGAPFWAIVPGSVLIVSGIAIIIYPQFLVWLAAIALIGMGFAMLMMSRFMRATKKS